MAGTTTGNTTPIYSKVADWQWIGAITTANTTKDLSTGTSYLAFTADATNGGFVKKLRIKHLGTNVATVMRVFINNGSATGTATNNILFDEVGILANTVSETAASTVYELSINEALSPGHKIYVTIGTAVAAGLAVTTVAGKY
jgi:hypothetical protein